MSTASEPPKSLPKWSAFEASAGLEYLRAARHEATVRATSMQMTTLTTRSAYHVACTAAPPPVSRTSARQMITTLATTRIAPSASAARCSAFPWPYWWPGSAGRTATPRAKNVRSAAMRSVPEWAASEMRPRLWVARPVPSLSAMSASAASTDQRAAFRWASTPESVRRASDRLGRPDERVVAKREVAALRLAQLERRGRGALDLRPRPTEEPAVVVHLGSRVGGEEAVALGQEELQRARLGMEGLAGRPVTRGEHAPRLSNPAPFGFLPFPHRRERHPRVKGGNVVDPPHAERGEAARGVDAEEPDAGQSVRAADVRADVQLQEGRDPGHRQRATGSQPTHAEELDPQPGAPVVLLDLELVRNALAEVDGRDLPVRPERVLPGLAERPAALGDRERPVPDAPQRACLPARSPRVVEEIRLPLLEVAAQRLLAL